MPGKLEHRKGNGSWGREEGAHLKEEPAQPLERLQLTLYNAHHCA